MKRWTKELEGKCYLCSTDPSLIQLDALNAALESDQLWWARGQPPNLLRRTVERSLCLGLYIIKDAAEPAKAASSSSSSSPSDPTTSSRSMVGFARVVTDFVTVGYLTDVYVLPAYQGRGLARWMMQCLDHILASWPELRSSIIIAGDAWAAKLYHMALGAKDIRETPSGKLIWMERPGPASKRH